MFVVSKFPVLWHFDFFKIACFPTTPFAFLVSFSFLMMLHEQGCRLFLAVCVLTLLDFVKLLFHCCDIELFLASHFSIPFFSLFNHTSSFPFLSFLCPTIFHFFHYIVSGVPNPLIHPPHFVALYLFPRCGGQLFL